jgi:hypothetical protein
MKHVTFSAEEYPPDAAGEHQLCKPQVPLIKLKSSGFL